MKKKSYYKKKIHFGRKIESKLKKKMAQKTPKKTNKTQKKPRWVGFKKKNWFLPTLTVNDLYLSNHFMIN